jgi:H+/gluconate symporter-like permease
MKKTDLLIGFLIGIVASLFGTYLFVLLFTKFNLYSDYHLIKQEGILGKIITLGAIFNFVAFFILLSLKKELMARGVVLATIILAIITIFFQQ